MSNSKKKREQVKRKRELRRQRRERTSTSASFVKLDLHREIHYITQLAQAEDSRVVTLGNLVLFSTRTRDAWLLDREDRFAVCLCLNGEPQPFPLIDTPDTIVIEWTMRFAIQ